MIETKAKSPQRGVSLGQRRANDAWDRVADLKKKFDASAVKDYAGEAKKLPIRIKASGLGQALSFIAAKAKKSKKSSGALNQLLNDLSDWVVQKRDAPWNSGDPNDPLPRPGTLLLCIVKGDTGFLRWSTDEVFAYLQWLNRFLEAEVEVDATQS